MTTLGDRIKRYEAVTHNVATIRMPLMVRVDGRAFHTFTKGMKPFDCHLHHAMVSAAMKVAEDMQGFKVAYIQSDEASFVMTDYTNIETQGWFDYDLSKIISISASIMSVYFNRYLTDIPYTKLPALFDSRAFNVPKEDVANALLWRAQDWERNSVQMYAQQFFSHKELQGQGRYQIHEMLYKIDKNWATDLTDKDKNGTFIIKTEQGLQTISSIKPRYEEIANLIKDLI